MIKISKTGLGILTALLLCLCIFAPRHVLADTGPFAANAWANANNDYAMNSKSSVVVNFTTGSPAHDPVTFTNNNPGGSTRYTATGDNRAVCSGYLDLNGANPFSQKPTIAATVTVHIVQYRSQGGTGNTCAQGGDLYTSKITIKNNLTTSGGSNDTGPSAITLGSKTYTQVNMNTFKTVYGLSTSVDSCYGGELLVINKVDSSANSPVSGTIVGLALPPFDSGKNVSDVVGLPTGFPLQSSKGICKYKSGSDATVSIDANGSVTKCTSNDGTNCLVAKVSDSNGPTQTTCEANSNGFSFAWAVCPVMDAASKLTDTLLGYFEDQLSFSVNQLGSSTDSNSGSFKVHHSWSIIKDIASSLVVIIMLVMVLSQAASFGPFDAYTIRKLLPRLVAVVILMQISWPLFSYAIDLVNDVARGLADIMYLPFGGADHMNLFALLANAHLGGVELGVLNWAAIGVGVALGVAFLFTMVGIAFTAIVALFFAFLTLVFRKILIILLLIFSPLALLAWILPGTERYWKMWRDNFFKALFMFPILVAIIAAGRVFAYVVGSENNGEFLNLIFILVGFFGPLFLAPRTFKWGGQAMQLAGNGIMKAGSKVSERPKKFLDKRQEGWSAERQRQSEERYSHGVGFNPRRPWRRPIDLLRSGERDPTLWGRRKRQAMDSYVAKGVESEEADMKAADSRANLMFAQVDNHDRLARILANGGRDEHGNIVTTFQDDTNGVLNGKTVNIGSVDSSMMRAGLNAVAKYGGDSNYQFLDRRIDELRSLGSGEEQELVKRFLDANVQSLQPKLKHFYYGSNRESAIHSMIGSMSENSFVGMEGAEMQAIMESVTQRIAAGDPGAEQDLSRVLTFYQAAIDNPNIRPNIGSGVNAAVEALVSGANLGRINTARTSRGLRPILRDDPAAPGTPIWITHPAIAPNVTALTGRIDQYGHIT